MSVKIYKDGIFKSVPASQVASFETKGFCRVDKNGKPLARSADAKALTKELSKTTQALDEANAKIEELQKALDEANKPKEQQEG